MTQDDALAILKTGASVFLTGEPGAGKTYTINRFVAYLRAHGIEPSICASTGIAATHIGGMTIHSWSGIGIKRDLSAYDLDKISQNKNAVKRIGGASVLIIDEVSMLSATTLGMVDAVCREVRRDSRPFGGLTVVLVGDFFQLPPVESNGGERDSASSEIVYEDVAPAPRFAFAGSAWKALDPLICYLTEQHRQSDEPFLEFLNAIRSGTHGERHLELLRTRYAPRPRPGVTQLYSRNANVDALNDRALGALAGDAHAFTMTSAGPANLIAALARGCLSPEMLVLKEGARVMFTKNDITTHRYANGTLGEVSGFAESGFPVITTREGAVVVAEPDEWHIEEGGRVLATIRQVPLRLAWAMTVHKSQGMSLDAAHMDLSDVFEYGQGYVALSRVRSLAGLSLAGLNARALQVHPEILAADAAFREQSNAAGEEFRALREAELAKLHMNFLRACGGSLSEIAVTPKPAPAPKKKPGATLDATQELIGKKLTIAEMAVERGLTEGTIIGHLEKLLGEQRVARADIAYLKPDAKRFGKLQHALEGVARKSDGAMPLGAVKSKLGSSFSFEEIRLARLFV